ncbi:anti-sigma factor domain-containing protein [Geodermatophilus sp. DSM 44513]|uniref:anti-sigma factor n=1 Tax=Geodermatophilus sp. DSM 44513 TaxID=1528104 RepID=UPI00128404A5|nr:anti-sigma factor [Geodermatophilus sp. DSM 44513]WNV77426.1 anti-sigma factor [Geodermatophilus sp. DSM 44513]
MSAPLDPRRRAHDVFDELAVGWALHALEPEDEELFAAHLPTCHRCRQTVAETVDVMGALAEDLPPVAPPERLRERLRAAVEETEQSSSRGPDADRTVRPAAPAAQDPPAVVRGPDAGWSGAHRAPFPLGAADPRSSWRRVLPSALVAAGVAAVLALGTWNVVLSSARDDARAVAAEQAQLVETLLTPGEATLTPLSSDGVTVATVVTRDDQVQLVSHGLAPNDSQEQTYVAWGISGSGTPVPLDTFDVTSAQPALETVGSGTAGPDAYTGYAVSLEPGREAPSEPTVVVAQGEVPS